MHAGPRLVTSFAEYAKAERQIAERRDRDDPRRARELLRHLKPFGVRAVPPAKATNNLPLSSDEAPTVEFDRRRELALQILSVQVWHTTNSGALQ